MTKFLDLEAPEEYVDSWVAELRRLLSFPSYASQEPEHYPLIRVVIRTDDEDRKFVEFLQEKMKSGEMTSEFKIIPVHPKS